MRIAFFTDSYHPQINGAVTAIDAFEKELRKHGHEVHVFCPADKDLKKTEHVHTLPSTKFYPYPEYRVGFPSPKLLSEVKKARPEIIHIHSPGSVGLMGLAIAKILRVPTILHYHTLLSEFVRYFGPATNIRAIGKIHVEIVNKYTKWFYNQGNLVISPSKVIKDLLINLGVEAPIEVLPNGVKVLPVRKKARNKIPIILHVGRLSEEKSIDIVVKAFALLKGNARLIITSKGPAEDGLKKLAANLGISNKVEFIGYISEKEKEALYRKADVFAFASTAETQGLVVLEAMSTGTPAVAARAGGTLDYVEDGKNGLLFEPGNYEELAKKITFLLKNKNAGKRLARNGFKTVKKNSVANTTKGLEVLYKKLLGEKISIIIPTYLEEKYIENTLKALQNQTYKNFEIIVSDSNSPDKTRTIAKKYADKVINVKQRGIALGRNRGAKAATGSIVLFLDADTALDPEFLEKLIGYFRKPNVVGVSGYLYTGGNLLSRIIFTGTSEIAWISTKIGYPLFYGMCMAWRKNTFDKIGGFNEKLETAEDIDFTRRMSKFGKCILARDARAYTSPRRLAGMGTLGAVKFHIINFFRFALFKRGASYPVTR